MSGTLEAPPVSAVQEVHARQRAPEPVPWTLRLFTRRHPWWTTAVILVAISIALVGWAGTRPSFDAYGWLVWGYQAIHGTLDLGGAPSWKPLPLLFTAPFAIFGHYELWLWMVTCVTISLAGAVFGGRIAYRLTTPAATTEPGDPFHRYAPLAAAVFAGASVLGLEDYMHYILSVQTDPMLVTFCLAALDMFLLGRYRWTLLFGVLAALGRPEVFPFLGVFMIWAWFKVPSMRWMLIAAVAVIAFMWFGVPTITNDRPDIAGELAQKSPRSLRHNQLFGTIGRFGELHYLPIWIAAAFAVAVAAVRRNWVILGMAAGAVVWVVIEIAFAYHGWPALPRYMFEPAAVSAVLGGVGIGWALTELPRFRKELPQWVGAPAVAIVVIALIPGAIHRARVERADLKHERGRTHQIALLATTTERVGGARHVQNCGQPVTDVGYVSALAYLYHRNVGHVGGFQQGVQAAELRNPNIPKVLFYPIARGGWKVVPHHTRPTQVARCRGLNAIFVLTRRYPGGVLLHR